MTLEQLNSAPAGTAAALLSRVMGSRAWVEAMLAARPFASREALLEAASQASDRMKVADWLEAFGAHPRIGDVSELRRGFASTAAWASREQAGAAGAGEETLRALAEGNRAYEERFGFRFIVCATGKSAEEMLGILRARLTGRLEAEWRIAAMEQVQISRLRLEKLLAEES